jgi:hypothetical protein
MPASAEEMDEAVNRFITNMVLGAFEKGEPATRPSGPDCIYLILVDQFEKDLKRPADADEREFFKRAADYFITECLPNLPD